MLRPCAGVFLSLLLAAPALAQETGEPVRRRRPQNNELDVQADVIFQAGENRYSPDNVSTITVGYVWLPGGGLDKNDDVVPMLRKFIRQPLELGGRFERHSDQYDTVTGAVLLGTYYPIPLVYTHLELGIEHDEVENAVSRSEGTYLASVLRAEAGLRVLPLLQLNGFYRTRSLFDTDNGDVFGQPAERTGGESWYGLGLVAATPGDRLLVNARVGYRDTDWEFQGFHRGTLTVNGLFAEARLDYQSSSSMTWFVRADVADEDWEELRELGVDQDNQPIPPRGQKDVLSADVDLGIVYWFEGKWGFRVALGGGYTDGPPVESGRDTGRIRLGVGFTSRY